MSLELPERCLTDLHAALQRLQPQRVLIAAPDAGALQTRGADVPPGCEIAYQDPDALLAAVDRLPVHDVVVLLGVIERLDKQPAERLIACLRDLHARHLFVLVPIGGQRPHQTSHWRQSDLLALGMNVYKTYHVSGVVLQWYRFELESYKATPDWLNSKYWANPELFGKYRW